MRNFLKRKIETFCETDKILILTGIHGTEKGEVGQEIDPKLLTHFKKVIQNFKYQYEEELNGASIKTLEIKVFEKDFESKLVQKLKNVSKYMFIVIMP